MEPLYERSGSFCIVEYRTSIDFEFCQNYVLIEREFLADHEIFILNFKNVSFIDSSGIGNLVGIYRTLNAQGKSLCLVNLTPATKKVLRITEIEKIFPIFKSLQDAKIFFA
jgi:anti-anti-sigma factor